MGSPARTSKSHPGRPGFTLYLPDPPDSVAEWLRRRPPSSGAVNAGEFESVWPPFFHHFENNNTELDFSPQAHVGHHLQIPQSDVRWFGKPSRVLQKTRCAPRGPSLALRRVKRAGLGSLTRTSKNQTMTKVLGHHLRTHTPAD